jgi:hypothetical protein
MRAPSSSASTWAKVVSCPCPWEAQPNDAVMEPVESSWITQVSVPVLIGMPGEAEILDPIPDNSA